MTMQQKFKEGDLIFTLTYFYDVFKFRHYANGVLVTDRLMDNQYGYGWCLDPKNTRLATSEEIARVIAKGIVR